MCGGLAPGVGACAQGAKHRRPVADRAADRRHAEMAAEVAEHARDQRRSTAGCVDDCDVRGVAACGAWPGPDRRRVEAGAAHAFAHGVQYGGPVDRQRRIDVRDRIDDGQTLRRPVELPDDVPGERRRDQRHLRGAVPRQVVARQVAAVGGDGADHALAQRSVVERGGSRRRKRCACSWRARDCGHARPAPTGSPPGTYSGPRTGSDPISAAARAAAAARVGRTSNPSSARVIAGCASSARERVPNRVTASSSRPSAPGTVAVRPPAHGNRVEAVRGERFRGERERQRTGAVERHRWSTWLDDDQERVSADAGRLRLDDVEDQRGGHRCVDRVATVAQDLHRGRGGARVRRRAPPAAVTSAGSARRCRT